MAAWVWMTRMRRASKVRVRNCEMTPWVCDQPRSCGLPMAKTDSPTRMGRPFCQGAAWAIDVRNTGRGRGPGRSGRGPARRPAPRGRAGPRMRTLSRSRPASVTAPLSLSAGEVAVDHVAIGDDQGIAPLDLEDHPRADRLAAQASPARACARSGRWPAWRAARAVQLLDHRHVRRRIGEEQIGASCVARSTIEKNRPSRRRPRCPAAGRGAPARCRGGRSLRMRAQGQDAQEHGDQAGDQPEQGNPGEAADQGGDRQPAVLTRAGPRPALASARPRSAPSGRS